MRRDHGRNFWAERPDYATPSGLLIQARPTGDGPGGGGGSGPAPSPARRGRHRHRKNAGLSRSRNRHGPSRDSLDRHKESAGADLLQGHSLSAIDPPEEVQSDLSEGTLELRLPEPAEARRGQPGAGGAG